ncbi:hypothetical protein D3C87_1356670 [compost metagenome]
MGEVGDQLRVDFVRFRAYQARSAEGLDLRRIDDTDQHATSCQIFGHLFPVGSGRFHTHARTAGILLEQPFAECNESFVIVFYYLVTMLAIGQAQRAVELGLGNVDSQIKHAVLLLRSTL